MSIWQALGSHRYRRQDDVLYLETHGAMQLDDAESWTAAVAAHFEQHPNGFMIVDARELTPPAAAVRRRFLTWLRQVKVRPRIVVFGANLLMRTASRLVLAAARQLYGFELDLSHVSTEAEAWTHIGTQHGKLKTSSS